MSRLPWTTAPHVLPHENYRALLNCDPDAAHRAVVVQKWRSHSPRRAGWWRELVSAGILIFAPIAGVQCWAASSALPSYFLRPWQTEEGLPHNAVTGIVQTQDGYLWLGTYDGLARFDGASFTVFSDHGNGTPEMRNSRVVSLFVDDGGTLWIGHETGELTRYRNGRFEAVDVNAAWENRKVIGIGSDIHGKVWLLNEEGRMSSVNGELLSVPNAGTSARTATFARNPAGECWVTYGGEIYALANDRLAGLEANGQTLSDYVTGVCASSDGGLWIVSGDRVRKWRENDWIEDIGPAPWEQSSITAAIETRSGCIAVGTLDKGLYLVFPHRGVLHFSRENGFPHDWVRCLYEDREGTLWAGTGSGGLVALRAGKVTAVSAPDDWQGRVVLSVSAAPDRALWVGTEGAGLYRIRDNEWRHFGEESGLSNQFVWSVSHDSSGRLWAGTWGGGVFVQNGERFERAPGLEDVTAPAPALLHTQSRVTWIGTTLGLLRYEAGIVTAYGRKDGLAVPDVRAVAEDAQGRIWFGMSGGGLGCLHAGMVRQFRKRDGLSNDYVQSLYFDRDGTLWIGTYGGGLNRLKEGRFSGVNTSHGLPNNFICHIEQDEQGNFWFSSHGGIFRVARDALNRCADGELPSVSCLGYGKGDGMPTLECSGGLQPSGCKTEDGRLWIPTSKGLVVVDPGDAKVNQLPPPVLIENLLVDGQDIIHGRTNGLLRIPPGHQRYEFRYTGLSFIAPEKVRFKYRLDNLETDWTDAEGKRTVNYSHIPPGSHTFRVIACNSDGVWNETGASLVFVVEPYFWQMWWFRIVAAGISASLLAGSVLVATRRRMRRKVERLERQQAVERERARIAQDIHDNLGASLTRISLLSQSVHGDLNNPAQATAQLNRIYDTARELTRALDEIVWAVNPQHDTLDSLASYLGKFAQDYLGPLQIRCRLNVPVQLPAWPLTAEVRHNLFLAFKEALHNVVKHAFASEVCISVAIEPHGFTLVLRDNGAGFATAPETEHGTTLPRPTVRGNGLPNMRRRLEKIGGRFEIESAPGAGTAVTFAVPVRFHSA